MKRKIGFIFLKYSWLILENKDGGYSFNIFNPLSYIALLIVAIASGISIMIKEIYLLIRDTFADAVKFQSQWTVVFFNVVLYIYLIYLWLL